MPIQISAANLISRRLRQVATSGRDRILNFNLSSSAAGAAAGGGGGGGWLSAAFSWAGRLVGFVSSVLGFGAWTFSSVFGWLAARTIQLSQFDWNATDAALARTIAERNVSLAATWGTAAGSALGGMAAIGVGVGVSFLVPVIGGAALARSVAAGAAPEVLQEISGTFRAAVQATAGTMASNALTGGYINIRRAIKNVSASTLTSIFGANGANWIRNVWGSEGAPRLTIADSIENAVQRAPGGAAGRAFVGALVEEAFDSFMDAGFIVAAELDLQVASAKAANKGLLGIERTVEIQPDVETGEKFSFKGPTQLVKTQIQNVLTQSQILYNRDVGQIVGQPVEEWRKAKPHTKTVTIIMRDKEKPPWRHEDGRRCREATYCIPDLRPGVGWRAVKQAANAYNWGKFRATANLDNGRQMAVYGASPQEAEHKLKELMTLSTANIVTLSVTEEKQRNRRLKKEITRMHPAFVTTLIRRPTTDADGGRTIGNTTYTEKHDRYQLWQNEAPENFLL